MLRTRPAVFLASLLVGAATSPARATAGGPLPAAFSSPAGFVVDDKLSKTYDFFHVPIVYPKGGSTTRIDPEGKTWVVFMRLAPPNKTSDQTDAAMRTALKAQGWEVLTPSGLLVGHKIMNGVETWFNGSAASGDYRASIVEVGPVPHSLALPEPASNPEVVGAGDDFPYLKSFPGSKLVRTVPQPGKSFNAASPGGKDDLVGPPMVDKLYDLPSTASPYEFMVVYRDALTKAGWTVLRTAASSDTIAIAHWGKKGRDIFVYLHGGTFSVADVGAQNEARKLSAQLAQDGHVAIYGIYFDVDHATLKPESETALQHVLELFKADSSLKLEVQGHTDNTGTAERNRTLSDQRAATVRNWLVDRGIAADRMTARGLGDTQPVADNKTAEGRAKNRRVELKKA